MANSQLSGPDTFPTECQLISADPDSMENVPRPLHPIQCERNTDERQPAMQIKIVRMTSEDEAKGKAYVHHMAWKEAYRGLLSQTYLDKRTLELSESMALRAFREGYATLLAKDGDKVIGFDDFGDNRGNDVPGAV